MTRGVLDPVRDVAVSLAGCAHPRPRVVAAWLRFDEKTVAKLRWCPDCGAVKADHELYWTVSPERRCRGCGAILPRHYGKCSEQFGLYLINGISVRLMLRRYPVANENARGFDD